MTPLLRFGVFLFATFAIYGQDAATLSVTVNDPTGATIPGAAVVLTEASRGSSVQGKTSDIGLVVFGHLTPGTYQLEADKLGFNKLRLEQVVVAVRDRQSIRLVMQVSPAAQTTINVTAGVESISSDPTAGISVAKDYMQNLPVNGRNAQGLILMTPGITSGGRGGFNSNGLRENTNYYTMDGVSANSGVGGGGGPGGGRGGGMGGGPGGPGGGGGGGGAMGGGGEMASIDSLQEVRVQTSAFAPEFGRSAGAQISMTSRAGDNEYHGSAYDYVRNDRLNANDWFANNTGLARGKMRQNRFGAVLGGPVKRSRTFFFASYDGLRLTSPATLISDVPETIVRRAAKATLRPFLNVFPIANGEVLTDGAQEYRGVVSSPSRNNSVSLRLDHQLSSTWTMFSRVSYSKMSGQDRGSGFGSANSINYSNTLSKSLTAGFTKVLSNGAINDIRVNVSRSDMRSFSVMDNFAGAVALTDARVFPSGVTSANGQFSLSIMGVGSYSYGGTQHNQQQQVNVVDSITKVDGRHHYKAGVDARYVTPTDYRMPYSQSVTFRSLGGDSDSLLNGVATSVSISSNITKVEPYYLNMSAYAQDTFRFTDRTTLTFGLRWDVNPAPGIRNGLKPFAVSNDSIAGVTQNDPLYATQWFNIQPRLGISYLFDDTPGHELIFRGGIGLFYDLGYGLTGAAFSGAPYSSVRTLTSAVFPLVSSDQAAPELPASRPYGQITAAETGLKSPRIMQFNAAFERNFGSRQSLTLGYSGTRGDRLLRTETQPTFSDAYDILRVTTNGATSNYNGFQAQFRRRMSATLQTQIGYTWSHSIDSASSDMGGGGGFATLYGTSERGNSDYDIRQNLSWSGSFRLPTPKHGFLTPLIHDWYFDWMLASRTGLPFDIQGITNKTSTSATSSSNSRGVFAQIRPDYNGKPVWVFDNSMPGGKRVNSKAFTIPDGYEQGNLGRNALRGFEMYQVDFALRRQLVLTERKRLDLTVQGYNVTNHPNFADPQGQQAANLSSVKFGVATRMLGGSGGGMGGGGSMYGSGGARQIEVALRLQF